MEMMKGMKVKKIDLDKADVVKQEVCGDACLKERFVIFYEELAGGRARLTRMEVRVRSTHYMTYHFYT